MIPLLSIAAVVQFHFLLYCTKNSNCLVRILAETLSRKLMTGHWKLFFCTVQERRWKNEASKSYTPVLMHMLNKISFILVVAYFPT